MGAIWRRVLPTTAVCCGATCVPGETGVVGAALEAGGRAGVVSVPIVEGTFDAKSPWEAGVGSVCRPRADGSSTPELLQAERPSARSTDTAGMGDRLMCAKHSLTARTCPATVVSLHDQVEIMARKRLGLRLGRQICPPERHGRLRFRIHDDHMCKQRHVGRDRLRIALVEHRRVHP